ncbi:MAG: flagellar export chaperone FliS [Planctomycetota bacterium]|jgi:flagellar protein FliS
MTAQSVISQYKKDTIVSAPPERLLLMLYDGAIRNLNLALKKLEAGDRAGFSLHLGKGQAIVAELMNSLDAKAAGKIGENLEKLYIFIIDRLIESNLQCKGKGISDSVHVMKTLKEGWEDAVRQINEQPA